MFSPIQHRLLLFCALAVAIVAVAGRAGAAEDDQFVLVDRNLRAQAVRVVALSDRMLDYRDLSGALRSIPIARCVTLVRSDWKNAAVPPEAPGMLLLADGQRLPGRLADGVSAVSEALAWEHPLLGRIEVPLGRLAAITFLPSHAVPTPGRADVVELRNGDRLEGFITALGDPISIEVDLDEAGQIVRLGLDRVAAVALVTPPQTAAGLLVQLRGGSVIQIERVTVADDGFVRLRTSWTDPASEPFQVSLLALEGILFDPAKMRPLATLAPAVVESRPLPRYIVPAPRVVDPAAPFGLGGIEYRGPIVVRYAVPDGCSRFAAEAVLPLASRTWGDYDLIVRDEEVEVFRARLNGDHPAATINVPLRGSELSIELAPGANGPIQDQLRLDRAMMLME